MNTLRIADCGKCRSILPHSTVLLWQLNCLHSLKRAKYKGSLFSSSMRGRVLQIKICKYIEAACNEKIVEKHTKYTKYKQS